ncbi:MAG: hypothetical protein WBC50_09480 [Dehalococcoidales bacterium]
MKKFLAVLSVLAFLFVAGPVQADWVSDLPIPKNVNTIGLKFTGGVGIITLKAKDGSCMEYRIVDNEIAKVRKCDGPWEDFVKK